MTSSSLVCWTEAPFIVLAINQSQLLGYPKHEIVGTSVDKLTGPLSNSSLFHTAIINTATLIPSKLRLILYDKDGKVMKLTAFCEPLLFGGLFVGCHVVFRPFQAVPIQKVLESMTHSRYAQCLVSLESANIIKIHNDAFVIKFGLTQDSQLRIYTRSAPHEWSSLLIAASDGIISRGQIGAQNASEGVYRSPFAPLDEAIFIPVAEGLTCRIRDVLVVFPPSTTKLPTPLFPRDNSSICRIGRLGYIESVSAPSNPEAAAAAPTPQCRPDPAQPNRRPCLADLAGIDGDHKATLHLRFPPPVPQHATLRRPIACGAPGSADRSDAAPSLLDNRSFPPARGAADAILPSSKAAPVVIFTPELLEALRGRPLSAAARAVGVSETAFKNACRRLGIRRWDYRRGPARHGTAVGPPSPA